jgi:hypothetical protein
MQDIDPVKPQWASPDYVRLPIAVTIVLALEALRPNDWITGWAELPIFAGELVLGIYGADALWHLIRRLCRRRS